MPATVPLRLQEVAKAAVANSGGGDGSAMALTTDAELHAAVARAAAAPSVGTTKYLRVLLVDGSVPVPATADAVAAPTGPTAALLHEAPAAVNASGLAGDDVRSSGRSAGGRRHRTRTADLGPGWVGAAPVPFPHSL